jgi:hypothetical protein
VAVVSVSMKDVVDHLDREEPDYARAAELGVEALPHLMVLVQGEDVGLATKAVSLASMIDSEHSAEALALAARHREPIVRVTAAASLVNLARIPSALATSFLTDSDSGVRKWALRSLEVRPTPGVRSHVEAIVRGDPEIELQVRAQEIVERLP